MGPPAVGVSAVGGAEPEADKERDPIADVRLKACPARPTRSVIVPLTVCRTRGHMRCGYDGERAVHALHGAKPKN